MKVLALLIFFFGALALRTRAQTCDLTDQWSEACPTRATAEIVAVGFTSADQAEASSSVQQPSTATRTGLDRYTVGVAAHMSALGAGGEVALPVTRRSNVRAAFNVFTYGRGFNKDEVHYAADWRFRSVAALYDVFPSGGGLHISPGILLYDGNGISATASVPRGESFSAGGIQYFSSASDPVTGTGKLVVNQAAPMFLMGFGNLVPRSRKHLSVNFEFGAAYQGPPTTSLNLRGTVCSAAGTGCRNAATDAIFQSSLRSEEKRLTNDFSILRVWPVLSLAVGYKF